MSIDLREGDCRESLLTLPDNSIDSVVTDPPYALISTLKRFGNSPRTEAAMPTADHYARLSRGFMGKKWDNGETAFSVHFWAEVMRVLKPGGHVVAFGASRGYHRLACAIEDAGSAARFFYSAKASKADRAGSKHPTVKPIALMQWLCRLVTPPGGTVLDPFAGSGTTGAAALAEGFNVVLCEREAEYVADIKRRFAMNGTEDWPDDLKALL